MQGLGGKAQYNTKEELDTIHREEFEDLIIGTKPINESEVKETFQNRPALQYLELMSKLESTQLTDKVRVEKTVYKAKRKRRLVFSYPSVFNV